MHSFGTEYQMEIADNMSCLNASSSIVIYTQTHRKSHNIKVTTQPENILTDLPKTSHAMLTKSDRSWSLYIRRSSNEYKSSPPIFA